MTPEDSFESAQYLASHAKAEFLDFKDMVKTLTESNHGAVVVEKNTKTNMNELIVRAKPLPHRMRGIASNIIKNLRDALDQAVHGASFHISGKAKRCCHFPFGSSPDDLKKAIRLNQCKDIAPELYPILASFEPFPTGDLYEGGNNVLRLLGRISGPHKHRVTLITTPVVNERCILPGSSIKFGKGGGEIMPPIVKDGEAVIVAVGKGGEANLNVSATFFVSFSHPHLRQIDALDFLGELVATVTKIVQDLQAEALAIGPRPSE